MDATGSMSHLLQAAKNTVGTMFERALAVLTEKKNTASFELQFAVYRNYSSREDILCTSNWESKPETLRTFMNTIKSSGGMGNEAIEIGLWHVNKEISQGKLSQVLLIGDMPPNTLDEIAQRRARCGGEVYWCNKFGTIRHYSQELKTISQNQIPIHAFYVDVYAKEAFTEIAKLTGGKVAALDVNSPKGAEDLTDAVTEKVLADIGGEEYVQTYREKFKKGHV